ncbi:NAD(P)H-dependent oxidoreductase [Neomoorella mulderi]|uniref:2-amino-4-deoxychorismate dehydrogenase n=1 Tax=Moorella mulderi DSM 14980 TaxID=1122241 RepID=A0A151ATI0_9FIRM|nr:NAD(P)H-dependent oxidoreductase [Moorella mulderi]KYH30959.1 2-amino-4-deoxychorismate dehydrogenase [Moorella mulderi DSM 14980]
MPHILAINGSPRGRESNSDRLLQPFLAGAREAGATTETIYVTDLKINDCRGCFTCWTSTPGRCVFRDDMPAVLEKIKTADILVLATPLYHFGMTARLKRLLERTLPLADPHIIKAGDHYTHPSRGNFNAGMVLIANCGFPDRVHFFALEEHMRQLTKDRPQSLLASILCAGGEILGHGGAAFDWYFKALHQAGREIVEQGHLTAETAAILARELVPREMYLNMANAYWDSRIKGEAGNLAINADKDITTGSTQPSPAINNSRPRGPSGTGAPPRNCREAVLGMAAAFNPAAAGNLKAVLQINLSGNGGGDYYLIIAGGRCTVHEGRSAEATTIINAPADVWLRIARGELDGAAALMQGLYQVTGDFSLMMKMNDLFSGPGLGKPALTRPAGPLPLPGMAWLSVAFLPWTLNWLGTSLHLNLASSWIAPALLALLIWLYRRFYNRPTWMESVTCVYFLVTGLLNLAGKPLPAATADFSGYLVLGAAWLATLATEEPLTAAYSRWNYPAGLATNPLFLRTNAIITAVWGEAFLFMAVTALGTAFMPEQKPLWLTLRYIPLILAGLFTAWFPNWYPAHVAAGSKKRFKLKHGPAA